MTTRQNYTVPPVAADKIAEFLTAYLSLDFSSEDDPPEFQPAESDYPGSEGLTNPDISPDPLLELMRKGIAEAEAEIARREAAEAGPQRRRPNRSEAITLLSLAAFATALPATAALERLYWPGTVTVLQTPPGHETAVAQALSWPTLRHLRALAAVGTDHADPKLRVFKSAASASRDRTADQRNFRAKLEPLLEQGASILLVTADRDVIDNELAEVTVLHLALPRPTPEAVLAVLRLTHPEDWEATDITTLLPSPADLARLSTRSIGAAFHAETAAEVARRLTDLARSSAAATGVTLDDVYGQPEAVRALRVMATDLSRWAQGSLDWAQVTASGLLYGPPGTGKSLMAQALAGTAGIPLISTSYADCQRHGHQGDMLAALSAKVSEAIRLAPSVFFIDEIDSFARRGGNGQTDRYLRGVVNGLLTELTRLAEMPGVIVLAATNYPDQVDDAVIRSGRIDLRIGLTAPDLAGISAQITAGLAGLQPRPRISAQTVNEISRQILGCSGADVAALLRAAATRAREAGRKLSAADLQAAADRISPRPDLEQEERIAIHEAGHVVAAWAMRRPVPRRVRLTRQGGFVESRRAAFHTLRSANDELVALFGGRVAETLFFGTPSSGAGEGPRSDLALATRLALQIEREWCLTDSGLAWHDTENTPLLVADPLLKDHVEARLHAAEAEATHLLSRRLPYVQRIAQALMRERELNADGILRMLEGTEYEDAPNVGAEVIPFPNFSGE
ncbi:AAA family ATPase [Rhodobacter capsulatus]|uniref:AAA family ATPase n=1 Tax=Rhodobacter capsulatus TaxID=1061 RepID=UPI0003D36E87|nr:AAA family ATPase [Rhodobacter capsulatus]ETD90859.1 ATPase AAA [Rhodobacter capsulatus YW2]